MDFYLRRNLPTKGKIMKIYTCPRTGKQIEIQVCPPSRRRASSSIQPKKTKFSKNNPATKWFEQNEEVPVQC